MIGFKYTNIKIQTAYIKFIIYSYLFSLFLFKPGFYFQFILTEFSRDSLSGENSKKQFEKFINDNIIIVDKFYEILELTSKSTKIKNYMWLTCVLNKDIKTNFNLLSNDEIEQIGRQEIINLMFDTFFIVLEDIKNKYKLDLNEIKSELYNSLGKDEYGGNILAKTFTKFDGSIENLIDSCFFIENIENVYNFEKRPLLISYSNNFFLSQKDKYVIYKNSNQKSVNNLIPKFADMPTQINELLNQDYYTYTFTYNDFRTDKQAVFNAKDGYKVFKNDLEQILEDIGYKGLAGQVFFKIKDQIDVQFRCGSEASRNPITLSFRNSNESNDFIYVQKFFEPGDKSYLDLEQFIFVRYDYIKSILKSDTSGITTLQKGFDEKTQIGIKFLEGNEIYTLESELLKTDKNLGFLALVPIRRTSSESIVQLLNDNSEMIVGTFNDDQRNLRMSYGDLTRIFGQNWVQNPSKFSEFNKDNTKKPKVIFDKGENINLDDIVDCYFSVYFNEFNIGKYYRSDNTFNYTSTQILDLTTSELFIKNDAGKIIKIEPDYENIKYKEGTFSILLENVVQEKLLYRNYVIGTKEPSLFLQIQKKFIGAVKLSGRNKKIFIDNFQYGSKPYDFSKLYDFMELEKNELLLSFNRTPDSVFIEYIKANFKDEIVESFRKDSSEEEKEILFSLFPSLVDPQENLMFKLTSDTNLSSIDSNYNNNEFKKTRAYKNIVDFITYYKNSVESLAKELQDNV